MPAWIALACATGVSGCATTAPLGHVELWLRSCAGRSGDCDGVASDAAGDEHVTAQAFIDPSASHYAPHGLYTYFELQRADGSLGLFELDVPTDASDDLAIQHFRASYRELSGEQLRFASTHVDGRIAVPPGWRSMEDARCACDDGGFELRFVDPGDDRVTGSDDDRIRRLSWGRFGWSARFCRSLAPISIPVGLHVSIDRCQAPAIATEPQPSAPAAMPAPLRPGPCAYGCYDPSRAAYAPTAGGCESSDSGGGCGNGSDPGNASSGGCGGDSSRSNASAGQPSASNGCEGDSSSSSSSGCEGDPKDDPSSSCAVAARAARAMIGSRRPNPFVGTGLPVVIVCLLQWRRVQQLRRRVCRRA